jgi:hypothetical protein
VQDFGFLDQRLVDADLCHAGQRQVKGFEVGV